MYAATLRDSSNIFLFLMSFFSLSVFPPSSSLQSSFHSLGYLKFVDAIGEWSIYPCFRAGLFLTKSACILQITARVSYNKIKRLHSYRIERARTYRHHMRIRFISIRPRWKHAWISLNSTAICPPRAPNVPAGIHACKISSSVIWARKYQSWNFLIPRGKHCMTRFDRKFLPFHIYPSNHLTIWGYQ